MRLTKSCSRRCMRCRFVCMLAALAFSHTNNTAYTATELGVRQKRKTMSEIVSVIWSSLRHFLEKYLLIFSTTYKIIISPYKFGLHIENSSTELKKSIAYVAEFYLLFFLLIQLVGGTLPFPGAGNHPLGPELLALVYVLLITSLGVSVSWIIGFLSKKQRKYYATVSAHLYWYGFIQLLYLVFVPAQIFLLETDGWLVLLSVVPTIGMLFSLYCFPTLFKWVAEINSVSWLKSFLSYWIGAILWAMAFMPIVLIMRTVKIA